jgi:acetyl-CoA acetyltransferase family protein
MRANRIGRDNLGPMLRARWPGGLVHQGISAELIAARWELQRRSLDAYAARSHTRAGAARDSGLTARDIVPVETPRGPVDRDEGLRPDTTPEILATLKPAFHDPEIARAYPQIRWAVTAGNASQVSDGAGAALLMEAATAERLGLTPRAAVTGFAVTGDDPILMLAGVIPATRKLLARTGLSVGDIDAWEVNEAFASVVLAWKAEIGADPERVNALGGAIALGHPVGASGIRLFGNLLARLEDTGGRRGVVTMCESGGMANATLIERP